MLNACMPQLGKKHIFQILCNLTYSAGFAFVYTDTEPTTLVPTQSEKNLSGEKVPSIVLPKFIASLMYQGRFLIPADSKLVPNL